MDENQQNPNPTPVNPVTPVAPTVPPVAPVFTPEPAMQPQQMQAPVQAAPQLESKYKIKSLKSITIHFVVSFLAISFLLGLLTRPISEVIYRIVAGDVTDISESKTIALVIVLAVNAALYAATAFLTMKSVFRKYRIQKVTAPGFIRNIIISLAAFLAFSLVYSLIMRQQIVLIVIALTVYAAVLFGMMFYIKKQIDKASI